MISISGIKYQKELENMPYLNKQQASMLLGKEGKNLDKKLSQLKKIGYLQSFKNNMYVTDPFYQKADKSKYGEYIANIVRSPSYISCEYVMSMEGLIPESIYSITSITIKSSRTFRNFLGTFIYQNMKQELFTGYKETIWEGKIIRKATKAKALFDYLYLKKLRIIKNEMTTDLRINWGQFGDNDFTEFKKYTQLSKSKKMMSITNSMQKIYVSE